jgi:hypothetical protein
LLVATVAIVNEDVKTKGSFKASRTGAFLADVGLYAHAVKSYEVCARGQKWAVDNVPLYFNRTRVLVEPYCARAGRMAMGAADYVKQTTPIVLDKVTESGLRFYSQRNIETVANQSRFWCAGPRPQDAGTPSLSLLQILTDL